MKLTEELKQEIESSSSIGLWLKYGKDHINALLAEIEELKKSPNFDIKQNVQDYLQSYCMNSSVKRVTLSKVIWFQLHRKAIEEWKERLINNKVFPSWRHLSVDKATDSFAKGKFTFLGPFGPVEFKRR